MSEKQMPMPDFIDVGEDVVKAAAAAMSRKFVLDPPDDAVVNTTDKGDVYKRWTEGAVIENLWREGTKTGLLVAVIQSKIRSGYPNENERSFGRHMLHTKVLAGNGTDEEIAKYQSMNDRSINAINTLLQATNYAPDSGGLTAKLLSYLFPVKNSPGAKSPLIGKSIMVNLVDSPNKGEKAKNSRQTNVDSYLPDTGD